MGYKVITQAGMGTREFRYPDAESYVISDGILKVGTGSVNKIHGSLGGQVFAQFNWDNVIVVESV